MTLWHWLGLDNVSGFAYAFWSGFGSIILPPLITLAGVALLWLWHQQCHVAGCYWPSRRQTAAGERACWRHHPQPKRTAEDVRFAHHAVLRSRRGHQEKPGDG